MFAAARIFLHHPATKATYIVDVQPDAASVTLIVTLPDLSTVTRTYPAATSLLEIVAELQAAVVQAPPRTIRQQQISDRARFAAPHGHKASA